MDSIRSIVIGLVLRDLMALVTAFKPTDEQVIHTLIHRRLKEVPQQLSDNFSIAVDAKFVLNQIIDLDERQQILTTSIYIEQRWQHPLVSWVQLNMSSVKAIRMPEKHVWTPDTYIHNNADDVMSGFLSGVYVLIHSNGDIHWPVRTQLKTFCLMDITMFPFDRQICKIDLGSWAHTGQHHILYNNVLVGSENNRSADLSSYTDNSDWILVSANIQDNKNDRIQLILVLQRRSFFYIWIFIVPFIMLTILSLMTFRMPSTSNEKLSLSLSVFMAFSMFMIMISEKIPPATRQVPLIGIYLATIMTMTAASIIITVLIINIYQRKGFERPSKKIRHLFIHRLAPALKIHQLHFCELKAYHLESKAKSSNDKKCNSFYTSRNLIPLLTNVLNLGSELRKKSPQIVVCNKKNLKCENVHNSNQKCANNNNVTLPADINLKSSTSVKTVNHNKIEWELIAVVLDYLFFYIFIVTYLFIYLAIFLTPFIFKPI